MTPCAGQMTEDMSMIDFIMAVAIGAYAVFVLVILALVTGLLSQDLRRNRLQHLHDMRRADRLRQRMDRLGDNWER